MTRAARHNGLQRHDVHDVPDDAENAREDLLADGMASIFAAFESADAEAAALDAEGAEGAVHTRLAELNRLWSQPSP